MGEHTASEPARQSSVIPSPNYTQVPNVLFDDLMADLSGAELKVLLYITRHTFGYGKTEDDISLSQLTGGIVKRDGERLDRGTGLHKGTVVTALKGLAEKGIIFPIRNVDEDRGDRPTTYHLMVEAPPRVLKSDTRGRENRHARAGESDTQKIRPHKETAGKRSRHVDRADPPVSDEDAETIAQYVDDMRRQLGDESGQARSLGQVLSLYARSGVTLERFLVEVYDARKAAQKKVGADNRWAYWYKVLEDRLKGGEG